MFQKGLSSPQAVKKFISGADKIIQEWLERVEALSEVPHVDYLPELSRLFLECKSEPQILTTFFEFRHMSLWKTYKFEHIVNCRS